jgi:deoxyribonuclease V
MTSFKAGLTAWPRDIARASRIQEELSQKVRLKALAGKPELVAGVDAAFSASEVFAVACLYAYPALEPLEDSSAVREVRFPYITGYLSFREGEAIVMAVLGLSRRPDLLLVDGQGVAHPRGIGIASHLGVLLGLPAVGCAKSRLIGEYAELDRERGSRVPLRHQGRVIGAVVRTRRGVRPLFVSPGHLIDCDQAVDITLACTGAFRIPEPLRRADFLSKKMKGERS